MGGFSKSYVIFRVGQVKCLRLLTRWVGGINQGQKHAYVIFEWSLNRKDNKEAGVDIEVMIQEKTQRMIKEQFYQKRC